MPPTHISKEVDKDEFRELIKNYKAAFIITKHTYFRLSDPQRKIYKDDYLISVLENERPVLVGIQENGHYAAIYKRKDDYLRIVLHVNHPKNIEIVTFYFTRAIPNL